MHKHLFCFCLYLLLNIVAKCEENNLDGQANTDQDNTITESASPVTGDVENGGERAIKKSPWSQINALLVDECDYNLHCQCHQRTQWTQQEMDNVKRYLQHRFYYEAEVRPLLPPCRSLYIRKNWKCLTSDERHRFVRALRVLYERGVLQTYGEIHNRWWAATHKTNQFRSFHRAFYLAFEREIWNIDPGLPGLPYWDVATSYAEPWKACVWKDMGWGGVYRNGYCVREGTVFRNLSIDYDPICMKRSWNDDNTVPPMSSAEIETAALQYNGSVPPLLVLAAVHFINHLSIGGWFGDNAVPYAPNDFVFFLTHLYVDQFALKSQLQSPSNLVPVTAFANSWIPSVDPMTGQLKRPNLYDPIPYYNRSAIEYWQFGYGDMCYIYDSMIDPINRVVRKEPPLIPVGVQRLLTQLSPDLLAKYYPMFAAGRYDFTTHVFEPIDDICNHKCRPQPYFQRYNDTANGRRVLVDYRYRLSLDETQPIQQIQGLLWDVIKDLNAARVMYRFKEYISVKIEFKAIRKKCKDMKFDGHVWDKPKMRKSLKTNTVPTIRSTTGSKSDNKVDNKPIGVTNKANVVVKDLDTKPNTTKDNMKVNAQDKPKTQPKPK